MGGNAQNWLIEISQFHDVNIMSLNRPGLYRVIDKLFQESRIRHTPTLCYMRNKLYQFHHNLVVVHQRKIKKTKRILLYELNIVNKISKNRIYGNYLGITVHTEVSYGVTFKRVSSENLILFPRDRLSIIDRPIISDVGRII